jgi:hypothetical protein
MVDDLSRQMLRAVEAGPEALFVCHSGHRLDQRLEASPRLPGPGMAVGRERDVDDAGAEARDVFGSEAMSGQGPGAIGLAEHVALADEPPEPLDVVRPPEVE